MSAFPKKDDPKYIDLLEEDKPISGQKFACVSFISPEKILKAKNLFYFQEFLKHYDLSKSIERFTQFMNFISYKYSIDFEIIMKDYQEYLKSQKADFKDGQLEDDYKTFLDKNEDRLQDEYSIKNDFNTCVRGLKIRGCYSTQEEAELRCKMLREIDPSHDVYVGPVGLWMPWEPEAYKTGRVEYLEEQLNELMSEKNKNESRAKQAFERRIIDSRKTAIAENVKIARETGNKLTQNIDEEGNLIGVNNTIVDNLKKMGDNVSSADIRKELFEKENNTKRDGHK